jgi:hypothetical protein
VNRLAPELIGKLPINGELLRGSLLDPCDMPCFQEMSR